MDLQKILAISGKPGLFNMVAQTKTGLVVESMLDGKRFTAFAHDRISSLEEISVYTVEEDKPLKEIFKQLFDKNEGKKIEFSKNDKNAMLASFEEAVPDYDTERVYSSDIKKILNWYNLLIEKEMLEFEDEEDIEGNTEPKEKDTKEETENTDNPS